jgi:RNA-directed DNA polymerase
VRFENEIRREARRLIVRHETNGRLLAEEHVRRSSRSTAERPAPRLRRPAQWTADPGFDPYHVRARATSIAYSVRRAFANRTYRPRHPWELELSKKDGGTRRINIYQVADSAVSKMLFEGILKKNLPLMSSRSYAYRTDLSAQNAIWYIKSEFRERHRLYVAEYDFRKYFDMIDHEHIRRILRDRFLLTQVERSAIDAFLSVGASPAADYTAVDGPRRERGIPQGSLCAAAHNDPYEQRWVMRSAGLEFPR